MNLDDSDLACLSSAQYAALRYVERLVDSGEAAARQRLTDILRRADCSADVFDAAVECVRAHARVVLHFHPDRFGTKRMTVAKRSS